MSLVVFDQEGDINQCYLCELPTIINDRYMMTYKRQRTYLVRENCDKIYPNERENSGDIRDL